MEERKRISKFLHFIESMFTKYPFLHNPFGATFIVHFLGMHIYATSDSVLLAKGTKHLSQTLIDE